VFTRCPACQAVYTLNVGSLAEAAGVVRCGNCGKTFNSLSELFAEHPDDNDAPLSGSGMPPMLDNPELVQAELPMEVNPFGPEEDLPAGFETEAPATGSRAWMWPAATVVLLIVAMIQFWQLWQTPGSPVAAWLRDAPVDSSTLDPNDAIQILSRDMHPHPSLDDAVIVSATLRNQTTVALPFPVIELRFYDGSQQVLAAQRVHPEQYLHSTDAIDDGLRPEIMVPLLMEFVIGTTRPSGFQIRFLPAG